MPEIDSGVMPASTGAKRILFVASAGGHLSELHRLSHRMPRSTESLWLTFDSPQSRSLLSGERIKLIPYVKPRDLKGVIRTFFITLMLLRRQKFDRIVSTGSAVAVGAFVAARLSGVQRTYIESVARFDRPSLTGRIISALRLAALQSQTGTFGTTRWTPQPSVLADFTSYRRIPRPGGQSLRVFVTLGTIQPYRFDELLTSVKKCAQYTDLEITWQVGHSTGVDLPGTVYSVVDTTTFRQLALSADVVVTHAGVGTLLELFDMGIYPVVVPRRKHRNEHVDDHQTELARLVEGQNLGIVVDALQLFIDSLREAARHGVRGVTP